MTMYYLYRLPYQNIQSLINLYVYRRETALQSGLVLAKSGRLQRGDNNLWTLQVYLQPLLRNWPEKLSNSIKKHKIRAITPFKVIEDGINRKPVCEFLLVINTN